MIVKIDSKRMVALLGALGLAGLASSLPAEAATVVQASPGQLFWTAQFLGSSSGNTPTTPSGNFGNDYVLSVPGQYSFIDSFSSPQSSVLTVAAPSTVGSYAFQDTYKFSVSQAASGDVLTVSLNLGTVASTFDISNLQFRLYEVTSNVVQPGLGIPPGSTVKKGWMGTSGPSTGTAIQANFSGLQAGTYFLDVAGTADGSGGGSYVGQLNLAPVPLPAAFPLLLSGLGLFGALRQRAAPGRIRSPTFI
jgi:hypothetical protein